MSEQAALNSKKIIALTFDDGPSVTTTPQVLDKLEKYGVIASFFLIGKNITEDTEPFVKRAFNMGCDIENHSRTHSFMDKMSAEEIKEEISFTTAKIKELTGVEPKFFRPPFIVLSRAMHENIDLPFICGYVANDWENEVTVEMRAQRILDQVRDGGIILLHDMEGNSMTVAALDILIPKMLEDGYEFVTISELFKRKGVTPKCGVNIIYDYVEQTEFLKRVEE